MNEHLVISLAFFASCIVLFKPFLSFVRSFLDAYKKRISDKIDSSFASKERVYNEMMMYVEKNKSLVEETDKIVSEAKIKAEEMRIIYIKELERIFDDKVRYMSSLFDANMKKVIEEMEYNAVLIASEVVTHFMKKFNEENNKLQDDACSDFVESTTQKH